ncbi:MAG: hypothetical protein JW910_13510 [Anaerolineae bacterium]|nr:hypothetical protein [Anaerolineae bacterium]
MNQSQNSGRMLAAFVLIGLGVLFLLGQFVDLSAIWTMWPFFVILPGAAFLFFAFTGGRDAAALAIPGAIVTGTGLILLFQSITDKWDSWAYVWTLYPVFLGLGLMFMGRRTGSSGTTSTGRTFVVLGLGGFLLFGAFFEVAIFGGLGANLLPLALILFGAWLLLKPRIVGSGRFGANGSGGPGTPKRTPERGFDDEPGFTGAPVVKPRGGYAPSASDALRREIDAVLAQDDDLDDYDNFDDPDEDL